MPCDQVKLAYVYQQVLLLSREMKGEINHADLRVWNKVRSEPSRKVIQDYLDELELQQKVSIERKPDAEGGWILVLIQPLFCVKMLF